MAIRRSRKAVAIIAALSITVAFVGSLNANSHFTIDAHGDPLQAAEPLTPDTPFTDADVHDLAEYLGVSTEEAELRLRIERASVGLEPQLMEVFGDPFGGAWLRVDGPPGLTVAVTSNHEEAKAIAESMFSVPDTVETVAVTHSLSELVALQERMIADRAILQNGALGELRDLASLAETRGMYDLDIDIERNVVVVRLENLSEDLADAFLSIYGEGMLSVEGDRGSPAACTRGDCRYQLRGGLRVRWVPGIDSEKECTLAFAAFSGNNYYVLSAAHCGGSGSDSRYHAQERYGTVTAETQYGRVDAERHYRSYPSPWYVGASIFVETDDIRPIYNYISWANIMNGTLVGKSGEETGTTRGNITSKYAAPYWIEGSNRFLRAEYCQRAGDSGGSVFNTNTAYGIHSGGNQTSPCYAYFGAMDYALDALSVSLLRTP